MNFTREQDMLITGSQKKSQVSESARDLVEKMLNPDPISRYSIQEVIQHPWFKVNLPRDWRESFEQQVLEQQQHLPSEQDIRYIIDQVFNHTVVAQAEDFDVDGIVDQAVEDINSD
eukprot:TRINITY_DN47833_c0_g1_i4.p2 TRINITY_DN47833_c0_g1~~TRINITY_DN47833_c0_g1_i4.p2  ORF type:complete len:116 (-),score=14.22 TRINITY_DN47833_c0_g1_i4:183-530(-)